MTKNPLMSGLNPAVLGVLAAASFALNASQLASQSLVISLPDYKVVLPPVSQVMQDREAKPLPAEYALAQVLRPLLDDGRYDKALQQLRAETTLSPALLLVKAQLQAQKSQWDNALNTYDLALQQMPQLVKAHQGKAIILLLQKRYSEAQTSLTTAIQYGLQDAEAYTQLAFINLQLNDAWSALGAFQQALMLDPQNHRLRFGLLSALIKTRQTRSALSLIESLLSTEPDNKGLWLQRANLAMSIEDSDTALASLETAMRLGDKEPGNYIISAQLHMQKGNYPRANALLNADVPFTQQQVADLMPLLAQQQQWALLDALLKKYQPQLETLTGVNKSRYHLYQAQLAKATKQPKAEKQALTQALSADPNNGQALLTLANLSRAEQNYAAAELYYSRATTLESVKKSALLGLAQTYLDQQDYDAALDNLVSLSKLEPHNKDIVQNIASIKRLLVVKY